MGYSRRRGMKSEKFTRVNYIESPGDTTGFLFMNQSGKTYQNTNIECTFEYLGSFDSNNHYIFGTRRGVDNNEFSLNTITGTTNGVFKCNSAGIDAHLSSGKHTIYTDLSNYYIDDIAYPFTRNSSFTWNYSMELFGCRNLNSNTGFSHSRIYEFIMKRGDTVTVNCIPVIRVSDGACGMLDTVSDVFYTNTGLIWG